MPTALPDRAYGALLFDMDGTILTSIKAAERVWGDWATAHGLDAAAFLPTIHGKRTVETIRSLNLPGVDAEVEAAKITAAEMDDVAGIEAIAGVDAFLRALPPERWAVVTSAPRLLAERRIAATGLPVPRLMVAAEDVTHGKPAPDPFLLGAHRLGIAPADCLVFEDTIAGLIAAAAAGMDAIVVTATHSHKLETEAPPIAHYEELRAVVLEDGRVSVRMV